jgi:PAS domain S-box-containing protein
MNGISNHNAEQKKFVEQTIFYRILLLAATITYLLSASADRYMNLDFRTFILPSAVVSFLLFSVFVLSFFVNTIVSYLSLLTRIIAAGILVHLIGLAVLNHFRPELLIAITASSFIASFVFRRIKILVLFDIAVCALLLCGIFIDQYFTFQLTQLKAEVIKPYIDPLFFLLSVIGTMIFAALLSTIRAVQFKPAEETIAETPVPVNSNESNVAIPAPVIVEEREDEPELIREVKPAEAVSLINDMLPIANIGLDYRFIKASPSFCDLTGYSEEELKDLKLPDIFHPEDKEAAKKILSKIFRGDVPNVKKDERIIKKSKQVIWVNISSTLVRDEGGFPQYVMTVMEDINRKKRAERTLLRDNLNLSSVLDSSDISVLNVDRNHTITYLNEPLKDILFGLTDIVVEPGFNVKQIIPAAYMNRYLQIFERGIKGEEFSVDEYIELIGGGKIDIEVSVHPIYDADKKVISITISGKDISERKQKERELIKARETAEAATEAKAGFLATMSHEIRTPLTGVIGMGKLLNQTELSIKQQEYVDSILLSGEALLSVINDILDFSKMESAKMELESRPISVKQIVSDTLELMSSKAVEKNLSLEYNIQKDVPRYIMGDITRLRQVLLNLVSNGIKFTMKGKISVHVSIVKQEADKLQLLFEVRDTGVGIPHEKRDRLFKSFSQLDSSTAKIYGGTGLGLAISKNLVSLMGGAIWVESEPGQGSSFQFTIDTRAVTKEEMPASKSGAMQLSRASILLLCEDKGEENIYVDYFRRWGVKVFATGDSKVALQWIKEGRKFNLAAIDAQLITSHAMVVASQMRNHIAKEELPIILFNVVDSSEITVEFTDKVISALIPKNIDRSKLLDILISVFTMEEHQLGRQEKALSGIGKQLAKDIPLRILVAEDNAINQKLAQNMFEGLGYKPDMVSNGLQVIEKLKVKEYDMLFMDVQMPEMGGLETTKYISQKLKPAKRPVIVAMTAFALEGDREKCIEAGMDDYISKPFLIEEIIQKIKQWGSKAEVANSSELNFPTQETEQVKIKHELVNTQAINRLRALGGENGGEFLKDVVNMFIQQAPRMIENINTWCEQKRWEEMGQEAHKLKGSALNIGAAAVADVCRQIELRGRNGNGDGCEELILSLIEIFKKTAEELKKLS